MADSVQALADEVAAWMGVGGVVTQVGRWRRGPRLLVAGDGLGGCMACHGTQRTAVHDCPA